MIYNKIKKMSKERGISVAQVEREAKLSNGTIGKWNDVSPTVANLEAVARVLKTTVDKLLEQKGET